ASTTSGVASARALAVRLTTRGTLDPTFGTGGRSALTAAGRLDVLLDAVPVAGGKVVAVGAGGSASAPDLLALRFETGTAVAAAPTVAFEATASTVRETAGRVSLAVRLSAPAKAPVTVRYAVS